MTASGPAAAAPRCSTSPRCWRAPWSGRTPDPGVPPSGSRARGPRRVPGGPAPLSGGFKPRPRTTEMRTRPSRLGIPWLGGSDRRCADAGTSRTGGHRENDMQKDRRTVEARTPRGEAPPAEGFGRPDEVLEVPRDPDGPVDSDRARFAYAIHDG